MTLAMQTKLVAILVAAFLFLVIVMQNSEPVNVQVLFWRATVDKLLLFPAIFLAGLAAGLLLGWSRRRTSKAG
jgi:uncharacterized integral membrane protein